MITEIALTTKDTEVNENKLTNAELAELLDDNRLQMMRTDVGMQRLRALALEVVELRDTLNEHAKLHAVLNRVIHPKADGPEHPSLCDLVAFVLADMKELDGMRSAMEAKISALNYKTGGVVMVQMNSIDAQTANAIHGVIRDSFPADTKAIICSPGCKIETISPDELLRIGLVPINRQPSTNSTH